MAQQATNTFKPAKSRAKQAEETRWIDSYIQDMEGLSSSMTKALTPYTQPAAMAPGPEPVPMTRTQAQQAALGEIKQAQEQIFQGYIPLLKAATPQERLALSQQRDMAVEKAQTEIAAKWEDQIGRPSLSKKGVRQYASAAKRLTVKQTVLSSTGVKRPGKPVEMTEPKALKLKLQAEARGAKAGYRQGYTDAKVKVEELRTKIRTIKELQKQFKEWVQLTLPIEIRGKMLSALASVGNERTFGEAIDKLLKEIDNTRRRAELARLKKFLSSFNKKYGRRRADVSTETARFKMAPEFSTVFSRVMDAISLKGPLTDESIVDLKGLIDYAQQEKQAAEEAGDTYNPFLSNVIVPTLEFYQSQMARQSIRNWDADLIREFTDNLMTMEAQWQFEHGEKASENLRIWELDKFNIIGEIVTNHKKPIDPGERDVQRASSPFRIMRPWLGFFGRYNFNLATLSNIVGGMKYGVLYKRLAFDLQTGRNLEKKTSFDLQDMFQRMAKQSKITVDDFKRWSRLARLRQINLPKGFEKWLSETMPEVLQDTLSQPEIEELTVKLQSGQTLRMNVAEALDIIMHTRNRFNYQQMLNSGIVFRDRPDQVFKLNANDIDAIWNTIPEKARAVKTIVDAMMDYQQQQINDTSRSMVGYDVANVDGYWHIRRKRDRGISGPTPEFAQETIESRSQWKERVGGNAPFVIGDVFNNLVETVQVGSEYVGMAEPMRKAALILKDPDIQRKVRQKGYEAYWGDIKTIIGRIPQRYTNMEWYDRWYNKWMRNITRAVFGLSPRLALQQYASVFLAVDSLGYRSLKYIRGTMDKVLIKRIEDWSPLLRERFNGAIGRELGEVAQVGSVMRFLTNREQIINTPTFMVRAFDKLAVIDVWRMAEGFISEKPRYQGFTKAELLKNEDYKYEVIQVAEDAITSTQPTWDILDRSLLGSTRNPFAKAATMFHSQREKMVQMMGVANSRLMNQLEDIRRRQKLPDLKAAAATPEGLKAVARAAQAYGLLLTNIALVKGFEVLYGIYIMNRDEDLEDFATAFLADIPGMFYFGDVARDVIISWSKVARGKKTYRLGAMEYPPMRVLTSTRMAAYETGILIMMLSGTKDATDTEIEEQIRTVLDKTWEAVNYAGGLPFDHITNIVQGWTKEP